jgi:hypothetical protein
VSPFGRGIPGTIKEGHCRSHQLGARGGGEVGEWEWEAPVIIGVIFVYMNKSKLAFFLQADQRVSNPS